MLRLIIKYASLFTLKVRISVILIVIFLMVLFLSTEQDQFSKSILQSKDEGFNRDGFVKEDKSIILSIENESTKIESSQPLDIADFLSSKKFHDFSLRFSSPRKMSDFLENIDNKGLRLLASLPQISTTRLRVIDPALASRFLQEEDSISRLEINQPIYQPREPRLSEKINSSKLVRTVGESLGLDEERLDWGRGVTLAVLDSGVDFSHPSLSHVDHEQISLIQSSESVGRANGHGTAISSIIAGITEDFQGVAPSAKILSIQVLDEQGVGDVFTLAEAIVTAVDKGSEVINLSLGGDTPSSVLHSAIKYASSKDVLMVAASGNDGFRGVSYPARYDEVIGVGALDSDERVANFSNYGEGIDIVAPGVGILSAWAEDEYTLFDGTSSAAAVVTGALVSEISRSQGVSSSQIKDLILKLTNEIDKPGFDESSGNGALNLNRVIHRNTVDYNDGAVVGYYFPPENLKNLGSSGTVPFTVTVQNQGTSWINSMNLNVEYRGLSKNYFFSNLSPGQTRSEQLFIEVGKGKEGFEIRSSLELNDQVDKNPRNNLRSSMLKLPTRE